MKISNQDVKKLIVDTNSCHLSVTTSNDGDFHMVTNNEDNFTLEKTDDAIIIRQKKRKGLKRFFAWIPTEIKVTVPAVFKGESDLTNDNGKTNIYTINLGNLIAKNDNGSLTCEDINAGNVALRADNGSVKVQGASFKSLDAHAGNGSIKLSDLNCEEFIKAKTSNGSVVIKNCNAKGFDFKSSNGSIIIDGSDCDNLIASTSNGREAASLLGNEADYAIDFSTSNGSIHLGNQKSSGRYVVKSEGKKLEAHTANGSIRFRFADTIDINTESADIFSIPDQSIIEVSEDEVEILNIEGENIK